MLSPLQLNTGLEDVVPVLSPSQLGEVVNGKWKSGSKAGHIPGSHRWIPSQPDGLGLCLRHVLATERTERDKLGEYKKQGSRRAHPVRAERSGRESARSGDPELRFPNLAYGSLAA